MGLTEGRVKEVVVVLLHFAFSRKINHLTFLVSSMLSAGINGKLLYCVEKNFSVLIK